VLTDAAEAAVLDQIQVRWVRSEKEAESNRLMVENHYLKSAQIEDCFDRVLKAAPVLAFEQALWRRRKGRTRGEGVGPDELPQRARRMGELLTPG
jgi:hypothetical protein